MTASNFRNVNIPARDFPEGGDVPITVRSGHSAFTAPRSVSPLLELYHPFLFYEYRLQSFTSRWPHRTCNLSPEKMAKAGFFYNPGKDNDLDNVTCPFCLKELTAWEANDDPLIEHSKRKGCYFISLGKCERDFTVGDFILLLAQRQASLMEKAYINFIESMEMSSERASEYMRKQSNTFNKTDRGKNNATKQRKRIQRK
uniref:Baculoviral IAP repeat-containing protein 5 n=1 Tax=Ascaris lumbricoides TaxID=6252 RepID=A0A0M3IBU3_ASCLU